MAYKKKNMKKKYVVCFVIICIFIIALVNSIYQEVKWGKNEPTVFYDVQAVHASESWDFFIIDDEDNFYVEDHEKNIVQRFNSKGEFQVGYSFGKTITDITIRKGKIHVLTRDNTEYVLETNQIIKWEGNEEQVTDWDAYYLTENYKKYTIDGNRVINIETNQCEVELKTPKLAVSSRWYIYIITFIVASCYIGWIVYLPKKESIDTEYKKSEYIWKGSPELKYDFRSIRRFLQCVMGIIGMGLVGIGVYKDTASFILIGVLFGWIGIGERLFIQYIKKRTEYFLYEKKIVVKKQFQKLVIYDVLLDDIDEIIIIDKTSSYATLLFRKYGSVVIDVPRMYRDNMLYDLKNASDIAYMIQKQTNGRIKITELI